MYNISLYSYLNDSELRCFGLVIIKSKGGICYGEVKGVWNLLNNYKWVKKIKK